jgi:hypothetical protein
MYQYKLSSPDLHSVIKFLTVLKNQDKIEVLSITRVIPGDGEERCYDAFFNSNCTLMPLKGILLTLSRDFPMPGNLTFRK